MVRLSGIYLDECILLDEENIIEVHLLEGQFAFRSFSRDRTSKAVNSIPAHRHPDSAICLHAL
jgi:hypothetical protein